MDQIILDEGRIQAGIELIKRLDHTDLKPSKAFWFYYPDQCVWKLLLGGKSLGGKDIARQYGMISRVMLEIGDTQTLRFEDVKIIEPKDKISEALSVVMRVNGLLKVRANRNLINGVYIDDALIYRLEPDAAKQVA